VLCIKSTFSSFIFLFIFLSLQARAVTADFTVSSTIGCAPAAISFFNTSSGATSYDWDFGDGSPHASTAMPSHTYYAIGSYTIILKAYSSSGASSTKSITIHLYGPPVVYFKASDTAVCVCNSITFTDSSVLNSPGTGTYNWQYGNGDFSTTHNPTYAYCTPNSAGYTVILKTTNSAGCFSSLSKPYYVSVYDHLSLGFSADTTTICGLRGGVNFISSISGGPAPYIYDWDFGDGTPHATVANPHHVYSSTTYRSYKVKLTVTSRAGCVDSIAIPDYISLTHVVASFTTTPTSASLCSNEYLVATNTSTPAYDASMWLWGDGDTSNSDPDTHMYSASGTYTLKLIT